MDDETMAPAARAMLTGSVLGPYVSQYCDHLRDGRYAAQTRRAGTLRVAQGKSRRTDVLPLPIETGRAIADYLSTERPSTVNRAVFVRHVAPYDEPIRTGVVQRAVRAAYRRCGWTRTRVHTLRNSVASRLLQQGTPLKEIANVLRHRSLDTSAIYAQIDDVRLAGVALPWPSDAVPGPGVLGRAAARLRARHCRHAAAELCPIC